MWDTICGVIYINHQERKDENEMTKLKILKGLGKLNDTKKETDNNTISKEMYEEVAKLYRFGINTASKGYIDRTICDIDGPNEEKRMDSILFSA